jgi:hypothetical protein
MTTTQINRPTALLILTLLLVLSTSVQATLQAREQAQEISAEQILRWPLRAGDSLVVKPCADCDIQTLQVTEHTKYAIGFGRDAKAITLNELLRQKSLLRDEDNHLIVIFFQPDNRQVSRVVLQTEL